MHAVSDDQGIKVRTRLPIILFFCAIVVPIAAEALASVIANGGVFGYTVDDGYIHLALAQRIQEGFYGLNSGEFAAPSSSILWPFLLAAVPSTAPGWEFVPFLINLASALAVAALFFRVIQSDEFPHGMTALCIGVGLLISLNLSSLVMSGKEHGLQVALTVTGVWGLVEVERTGRMPYVAVVALIAAPLIRYENFATTFAACGYLVLLRRWRLAFNILLPPVCCAAIFSGFLLSHGLGPLPTSVTTKQSAMPAYLWTDQYSNVLEISAQAWADAYSKAAHMSTPSRLFSGLMLNLKTSQAWSLLLLALPLVWRLYRPLTSAERRLAGYALLCLAMHLVGGFFDAWSGWCYGYEMYVVALELFVVVVLYLDEIRKALVVPKGTFGGAWLRPLAFVSLLAILFSRYATALLTIPLASSYHYSIETQAALFGSQYWKRPMGVEPLGTAFWNHNYVLDYGGLSSVEAASEMFAEEPDPLWMDKLARKHGVGLVTMGWQPVIPPKWPLIARLHWSPEIHLVFPDDMTIEFYATDPKFVSEMRKELDQFARALPKTSRLEICQRPSWGPICTADNINKPISAEETQAAT